MANNIMILERSSENLQKVNNKGKTILEGVFCTFNEVNRNDRIYKPADYLKHVEYLKTDCLKGVLLGELDHPERFEVSLNNVSHRVTDLWYDQQKNQILGRVEILEGTPKGAIAKALLDAGIPLSISSRAAGTVREDKTVDIQQIYTYDLVAKPGFADAQLHSVTEGANTKVSNMISLLNESYDTMQKHNISQNMFNVVNENLTIIDMNDKYPSLKLREEAIQLNITKNKNNNTMSEKTTPINEDAVNKWTIHFNNELSKINEKLESIQSASIGAPSSIAEELKGIKKYIEKLRSIQEGALNWQGDIAKAVNKTARFADTLASKSNEHYDLTQKISETVDYNAKVTNGTLDWNKQIAESLNDGIDTISGLNKWNSQMAKAINDLNEWSEEKASAINDMHEWVSDVAKHTNGTINYTEDMLGRAISKDEAKKIMEYIDLVSESKDVTGIKGEINEMLSTHSITSESLNEGALKGISVIDEVKPMKKQIVGDNKSKDTGVEIDKNKTIVAKLKTVKFSKSNKPKDIEADLEADDAKATLGKSPKVKGIVTINTTKTIGGKAATTETKTKVDVKVNNLKLDVKPQGKLKESTLNKTIAVQERSANLFSKLDTIISGLEKEKALDEETKTKFPFTGILNESDRKRFEGLSLTEKEKVSSEVAKVATTDAEVINKVWENALANRVIKNEEPLWLSAAPKKYRDAYEGGSESLKESIRAKSEFFLLETQYQINNFWETSGVVQRPTFMLNEEVSAVKSQKSTDQLDTFVSNIGDYMKNRYNN